MDILKKLRMRQHKQKNQGNSYIMVVATISFLAVLTTALLVAVALCYRLKAYDINARDNFYYLEQAMDEIYAGVGADSMKHLNSAYDDTLEVLVYYDVKNKTYRTMDSEQANNYLKLAFMNEVKNDPFYQNAQSIEPHLVSFLSNPYSASNDEGVQLSVERIDSTEDTVTLYNVVLKREAAYSTVNTLKADANSNGGDTFVQSITTDLVISKPEFEVSFNSISAELNTLYPYSIVADAGIEIDGATTKVDLIGDIYAAADFYNKDYNITDKNNPNYITRDKDDTRYNSVCSYDDKDMKNCDGLSEKSMYSGIYMNGARVMITASKLVVPGTIAAMNGANVTITSPRTDTSTAAVTEVWADGIVLGGYSLRKSADSTDLLGSVVDMRANAYIADDLELNAKACKFTLNGQYYGYNYASLDNRTYTDACIKVNGGRTFVDNVVSTIKDGSTIEGQAHYNSSAIIVNGEDSELDLTGVNNMYIAGQAYVELSKQTTNHKQVEDAAGNKVNYQVTNKDGDLEYTSFDTYDYAGVSSSTEEKEVLDEEGNITKENVTTYDNYSETNSIVLWKYNDKNSDGKKITLDQNEIVKTFSKDASNVTVVVKENDDKWQKVDVEVALANGKTETYSGYIYKDNTDLSTIQDYRTGEAISVKSNQLAYIPNWAVHEDDKGLYISFPAAMKDEPLFTENWDDISRIPVVKTVISGKPYYFFDFSGYGSKSTAAMNKFIAEYANLFTEVVPDKDISKGESYGLTDITDYEYFEIEMLDVKTDEDGNTSSIYSNSAISIKKDSSITIKANSDSIAPLLAVADELNANNTEKNKYVDSSKNEQPVTLVTTTGKTKTMLAQDVTAELQNQYKEMKWLLSTRSNDATGVQDARSMEESDITPINHFFDFSKLKTEKPFALLSGHKVWLSDDDVTVTSTQFGAKETSYSGLIICKGDVKFDKDIESFNGLIIAGGKIIIDHSMTISASENTIKKILDLCDESQRYTGDDNHFNVCELFRQYVPIHTPKADDGEIETVSTKSISAVQFEDILGFKNWKKNVD
ncbi:MAG: hypothetical protein ACI4A3_08565 [Lachnospiraceae bacterium]